MKRPPTATTSNTRAVTANTRSSSRLILPCSDHALESPVTFSGPDYEVFDENRQPDGCNPLPCLQPQYGGESSHGTRRGRPLRYGRTGFQEQGRHQPRGPVARDCPGQAYPRGRGRRRGGRARRFQEDRTQRREKPGGACGIRRAQCRVGTGFRPGERSRSLLAGVYRHLRIVARPLPLRRATSPRPTAGNSHAYRSRPMPAPGQTSPGPSGRVRRCSGAWNSRATSATSRPTSATPTTC